MVESNGRALGIQHATATFDIPTIFFVNVILFLYIGKSEKVKLNHKMQLEEEEESYTVYTFFSIYSL